MKLKHEAIAGVKSFSVDVFCLHNDSSRGDAAGELEGAIECVKQDVFAEALSSAGDTAGESLDEGCAYEGIAWHLFAIGFYIISLIIFLMSHQRYGK